MQRIFTPNNSTEKLCTLISFVKHTPSVNTEGRSNGIMDTAKPASHTEKQLLKHNSHVSGKK